MDEEHPGSALSRGFAAAVVRLRWLVVAAWIAGAAAATIWLPGLDVAGSQPLGGLIPKNAEALEAGRLSAELFPIPIRTEIALVEQRQSGLTEDEITGIGERAAAIDDAGGAHPSRAIYALPIVNDPRLFPEAREHGTTAITWLAFPLDEGLHAQGEWAEQIAAESEVARAGGSAGVTGSIPARLAEFDAIGEALPLVEAATVGVIAILLAAMFRSLVAPLVALVAAGLAYLVALGLIGWVGQAMDVSIPADVEPLVVVVLLGIVTDYAIFFLSGVRARLEAGDARLEAAESATVRVVPVVVTAGLIVSLGAASLLAGELEFFRAFGPGLALAAVVGLAVSMTLVPALLAVLGRVAFWPSPPLRSGPTAMRLAREDEQNPVTLRARAARLATNRPVAALMVLITLGVIAVAASGLRETNLGLTLVRGLPEDAEPNVADRNAGQGFAAGIIAPTEIIVEGSGLASNREGLVRLEEQLDSADGVAMVVGPREAPDDLAEGIVIAEGGNAARYAVVFDAPAVGGEAIDDLERLRETMPELLADSGLEGAEASFAGDTALAEETVNSTMGDVWRIGLTALGRQLRLARRLPARARRAARAPGDQRGRAGGDARRDDLPLPGFARIRRAHLLRPVRGGCPAGLARLGLQRVRRGGDRPGGGQAPAARSRCRRGAAREPGDRGRGRRARGELRHPRDRSAAGLPRACFRAGRGSPRRCVPGPVPARAGADLAPRTRHLLAGAEGFPDSPRRERRP